jgi:fibronectin-binding autotransporter adhesin
LVQVTRAISDSSGSGSNMIDFRGVTFHGGVFRVDQRFIVFDGGTLDVKSTVATVGSALPVFKMGGGKLVLSGNNTFTADFGLDEGTVAVGSGTALGSGTLFLAGGTLEVTNSIRLGQSFIVTRSSTIVVPAGAVLELHGNGQIFENQTLRVVANGDVNFFDGILSGPGGLTKSGAGTLGLGNGFPPSDGPNTYEGGTVLEEGTLVLGKDLALGRGSLMLRGGELRLVLSRQTPNALEVSGGAIVVELGGEFAFSGPVTIQQGVNLVIEGRPFFSSNLTLRFSGRLSGAGGLTTKGSGLTVVLSGTAANTYSGPTTVGGGTLVLNKAPGVTAIAGPLIIGDGVGGAKSDVVSLGAANQIADDAPVKLLFTGLLKLNNFDEALGSVEDDGYIEYGDPPTLTVGFNNLSTTFAGVINGLGELIKVGSGAWTLTGNNTFSGTTTVNGGALIVNGSLPGPVTVNAGATLGGTGATGPVTLAAGAVVSPGGAAPGVQHVHDLALSSGSSYVVQLDGPAPGTGYDQLDVIGSVSLGGATLDASLGFAPAPGDRFVIVNNDGTDPVVGTFAGLPQGASLRIGGVAFHVYYDRGDGNDVVLVRNVPPAVTLPGAQTAFQNVDLAINGISVADVDDVNLTVTLRVGHGTLTPGTVAGLTVGGNGTSAVTLSGSQADLNAALAGLMYGPDLNYSGPDTLTIRAGDGLDTSSAAVAIRVKSLAEQAADLEAQVNALRATGALNQGQANSLVVKLDLKDNDGDIGRVQAFLDEVGALLGAGILSPAQADILLTAGNILLTGLRRR